MRLPNPVGYFENPRIEKRGKHVLIGGVPSREIAPETLDKNMILIGQLGKTAEFFGYHATTQILYLFATEEDQLVMLEGLRNGTVPPPLFPRRRAIGGPGTLDLFLKNKHAKKIIAAVQFYNHDGDLIVTHMVVRPKWRRAHINTLLIEVIVKDVQPKNIWWEEPTLMGSAFMKAYGKGRDLEERPLDEPEPPDDAFEIR